MGDGGGVGYRFCRRAPDRGSPGGGDVGRLIGVDVVVNYWSPGDGGGVVVAGGPGVGNGG